MKEEIWKDIEGYKGYQVSNLGNVKSLSYKQTKIEKKLTLSLDKDKYLTVSLCKNGKKYTKRVNRLVAQVFIPNPNNLSEVNHIDCNKQNNCVNNLEWVSRIENMRHAIANNLTNNKYGKDNLTSKVIYQIDIKTNKILNIFYGTGEIKRKTQFKDTSSISKCCRNVKNYKTAYGYKWQYAKGGETNE